METTVVIRRKDSVHAGKLIGPFDLPGEAVAHAMGTLGLDSSQYVLESVHPPHPGRPNLTLVASHPVLAAVPNDAA